MKKLIMLFVFGIAVLFFSGCSSNLSLLNQSQFQRKKDLNFIRINNLQSRSANQLPKPDIAERPKLSNIAATQKKESFFSSGFALEKFFTINDSIKPDTLAYDSTESIGLDSLVQQIYDSIAAISMDTLVKEVQDEWEYVTKPSDNQNNTIEIFGLIALITVVLGFALIPFILSLSILIFIASLILSFISLFRYKKFPNKYKAKFIPVTGLILSVLGILFLLAVTIIILLLLLAII